MLKPKLFAITKTFLQKNSDIEILYRAYLAEYAIQLPANTTVVQVLIPLLSQRWIAAYGAAIDDKLVGFCIYSRTYSPTACSGAFSIDDIYVAPDKRRTGIATAMITKLANHARQKRLSRIYVRTDINDQDIMCFYTHNRFVDANAHELKLEIT